MRLFPRTLAQKLIVSLTLIVALFEGISGAIDVKAQERKLLEVMVQGADQLSRGITAATWQSMLMDRRDAAYDVMQTIGRREGISLIRIFNKEGRVMFSTEPSGPAKVDKSAQVCSLCHATPRPLVHVAMPSRARVYEDPPGSRRLAMVTPIYNEPSCSTAACHAHPESQSVLGILEVALDLRPVDQQIREMELRALAAALVNILLIALFIVLFTRYFVDQPIHNLIVATREVSEMQLDRPVEARGAGELGELARSFNVMRERLAAALDQLNRFTQSLEAKVAERTTELESAHKKLLQSDRLASLGQLSASVAHEINNPVSGVLNLSTLLQRILTDDGIPPGRVPEFQKYLGQIVNETARVGRIVSDLLAFSRRGKPQRTRVDLNAIVRTTVSLVGHKLELMEVARVLELAPDLPQVLCDAAQIQQVIMNLVLNGAEATRKEGRGTVRVRTRPGARPGTVALEVADTGEGIAPEQMAKLFQPFFTTKEDGKGVGLGLAVVYGIVQAHNGEIEVESEPGGGATFRIILPVADEGRGAAESPGGRTGETA